MDFLFSHILTWRLPVALVLLGLAVLPIIRAYRALRAGNVSRFGVVDEGFLSGLLVCIAAGFFPPALIAFPGIWFALARKHLMNYRVFFASLLAMAVYFLYYFLAVRLGWIDNVMLMWFNL